MVKTKNQYCDACNNDVETIIVERPTTYTFKGETFNLTERVLQCKTCKEDLYDEALDNETMKTLVKLYTERVGLPLDDIKNIRKQYGLSMDLFSRILGWSKSTIVRYESGKYIPDSSHMNIYIQLKKNPEKLDEFFKQRLYKFTPKEQEKIKAKLSCSDQREVEKNLLDTIVINYKIHEKTIETGYSPFNLEKLINMVLYFAQHGVQKTKLMKLLFYSDYFNFKKNTLSITGLPYVRFKYGPVPKDYDLLLSTLEKNNLIKITYEFQGNYVANQVNSLETFNESIFDEHEFETLQRIDDFFIDYGSGDISEFSHKESAWKETDELQIISYEHAETLLID
ncbi:DUF4065 domain-containing protein [Bacillus atrophaeus]|uniref:type II TA system antitoxin MqsA family protein n=1 Tax=Bacillus atrophaeus TaxID=1452 RepID=UPI00227FBA3A|nr:type II TA system antitoxin MqsA family protein [Bacillus atrophaeus]MCY8968886.1 DUF4065 domain-containing protein [Bacillus atrophaeus]